MMYKNIDCPHCGNETLLKNIEETQKCKWCRRLISVKVKHVKGKKYNWEAIPVDFEPQVEIKNKSLKEYEKEDIYGL